MLQKQVEIRVSNLEIRNKRTKEVHKNETRQINKQGSAESAAKEYSGLTWVNASLDLRHGVIIGEADVFEPGGELNERHGGFEIQNKLSRCKQT
jgi:hypothetical protein